MRIMTYLLFSVVVAITTTVPVAAQPLERNPFSSADAFSEGRRLYLRHCVSCHGPRGNTGSGAKLATTKRIHGTSDQEMYSIIFNGIAGTAMPGLRFSQAAAWKILLFVRSLEPGIDHACTSSGGDVEAGHKLFMRTEGCSTCHTVGMKGGRLGPDLSNVGAIYTRSQIHDALLDPNKTIAKGHRAVKVVLRTGGSHEGVLLNEDGYSLHMMGRDEEIYSFMKQDLVAFQRLSRSLMPSYGNTFSGAELENLTAYLCNLGREHP